MKKELNFANRQRNARTGIIRNLERLHPGMIVFSEAFQIQHPDMEKRKRELAACAKMKGEFQTAGVACAVVLTKVGAYVLRAKAGLQTNLLNHKEAIKAAAMPRRKCFGAKRGEPRA